jgi:hypothetical protein
LEFPDGDENALFEFEEATVVGRLDGVDLIDPCELVLYYTEQI